MMDGVRPRGIIRMMVPFGSISFATLSANGRYLRIPAEGRSRRYRVVADREGARRGGNRPGRH